MPLDIQMLNDRHWLVVASSVDCSSCVLRGSLGFRSHFMSMKQPKNPKVIIKLFQSLKLKVDETLILCGCAIFILESE